MKLAAEVTDLPPVGYKLVFSDESAGDQIDTGKWNFRVVDKMRSALQRENVSVRNGNLEIALRKESVAGKNYTAGGVISRQTFVHGYYEARFKTPPAEGWHTALWSMRHNDPNKKSKLPNVVLCDYIRVHQHPKYREAEASVRAGGLRPLPPLGKKKTKDSGPKLEDLN